MLMLLSFLFAANSVATTSSIHATIRGTRDPLVVSLLQRDRMLENEWHQVAQRRIEAKQRHVDFDGLAAGVYQVRVQRDGGYEQAGTKVVLGAGEKRSAEVAVDPVEISGSVLLVDVPLSKCIVKLRHADLQWNLAIPTGDDGKFRVRLWQRGSFEYLVRSPVLATPYHHFITFKGRTPIRWDLRLPDRRVIGTVRDRVTGAPIAGATLRVNSVMGDMKHHSRTEVGTDGRFDLAAMEPSIVTIDASREGYLDGTSDPLTLFSSDRLRETVVTLEPGDVVPLTLRDSKGRPVADATMLTVIDGVARAWVSTGSDGRARVTLPRGRAATLYAIPHEGSFAVVHIVKPEETPAIVTLPHPASSLRIVTRTTDGKPLTNVALLMRANGELIPPIVAEELEVQQKLTLRTDERGEALLHNLPSGSYEFWPYSQAGEAAAIAEGGGAAPIVVDVKTGENSIAVNFRAR
ncbi:MAG TPA: carboxypeptidase-like regulatory domain-containing protein [Thermoanaerobaculia bacterium]|jgi:hypothetical protein